MPTFREQTIAKYKKYRAALIALNALPAGTRADVDFTLAKLSKVPTRELRSRAREIDKVYRETVNKYGVIASLDTLEHLLENDPSNIDRLKIVPKFQLAEYFTHYDRAHPVFADLPPHAAIGIDVAGCYDVGGLETFQLEASLFEDLASLWNLTVAEERRVAPLGHASKELKRVAALTRATAKAAFNLLEGFLNGLAFDIRYLREVSVDDMKLLSEWDPERKRAVYLSLRDKLLKYPKLAIGAKHPPIQESASVAMRTVLQMEVEVRHALIHPGPSHLKPKEFREKIFYELTSDRVASLCDATVSLIEEVSAAVGAAYGNPHRWLTHRGVDGLFPAETFR